MITDQRSEAERRYDMERTGELYTEPESAEPAYAERFALGFQHGQEIAARLNADTKPASAAAPVRTMEDIARRRSAPGMRWIRMSASSHVLLRA
jgi:hypothetical protein